MKFTLDTFTSGSFESFHLARITLRSKEDIKMHTHDYAEIFWIEEGDGFHLINGEKIKVFPGYMCMVRPNDKHAFKAKSVKYGLTVTNLAFHMETLSYFQNRYFPNTKLYFWSESHLPFTYSLSEESLKLIRNKVDQVMNQLNNNINLDRFLLFIFGIIQPSHENMNANMPYWMQSALEKYNSPFHFKQGVEGFLALTNRSLDHCNRILKKNTSKTLTETINEAKIKYAGKLLVMTNASIKTIASDCGFGNMGYFYKIFKFNFKMSPKDYRVSYKKII